MAMYANYAESRTSVQDLPPMSLHRSSSGIEEQVARESTARRNPGLTLAFASDQTYFVAQTELDNGNFELISR
jgi:hypothetical protein